MASLGFQATQTAEFGDYVNLAGRARELNTITVTMSDWATHSNYPAMPDAGWTHPITINVYAAVPGAPLNTAGPLLGTITRNVTIPWRPEDSPACAPDNAWQAADGLCYHGVAFNATFKLRNLQITLPEDVIIGVAYNTQSYGSTPIGAPGPYNSLNVGVEGSATVGSDVSTDNVFWNTSTAASYTDGGLGGVGIFREDTNWTPYGTVALKITASGRAVGHSGSGHENDRNDHRDHNDHGDHSGANLRDR